MLDTFFSFRKPIQKKQSKRTTKTAVKKQFQDILYTHSIHKKARSYRLKIDANNGLVVVTPPRYNQDQIETFIATNKLWIATHLNKLLKKKEFLETETTIRVFDTVFEKEIVADSKKASFVQLDDTKLIITVSENNPEKISNVIERFLKQTAEQYIVPRTQQLAKKMQTDYARIKFGQHKSQWGSCHTNGTLTFNWRLVHAPAKVIDYVIIHELAHRTHLNHSSAFWALVAKYDPNYVQHKQWLKRYGLSVG